MSLKINAIRTLKRIAAIGVGAAMLGATALGAAVAADTTTFSQIAAAPTDTSNALKAFNALQGVSATGDMTYEDFQLHKELNDTAAYPNGVDHAKLAGLWKGTVNIDLNSINKDYRTREKISFFGAAIESGLSAQTRGGLAAAPEFKDTPFMSVLKDQIRYQYLFDEDLNINNRFANASSTNPVWITILGHRLRIEGASADNKMTVVAGEYCDLLVAEECTAYGHKIKFEHGSSAGAKLSVDGEESEWITDAQSYKFKNTGVDIYLEKVHDIGQTKEDFNAEVWISDTKSKKEYTDGDEFIGEDENDPNWVWELTDLKDGGDVKRPSINVSWDSVWDMANEVVYLGDSFALPGGKATIKLDKLTKNDYRDYVIGVETVDLYASSTSSIYATSAKVIYVESQDNTGDGIKVNTKDTDKVYILADTTGTNNTIGLYYKDTAAGSKAIYANNVSRHDNHTPNAFTLEFEDTSLQVSINTAIGNIVGSNADMTTNISFYENASYSSGDDAYQLKLYTKTSADGQITYLGEYDNDDTSVAQDWCYTATAQQCDLDIGGYSENVLTDAGIILLDPKASAPADEFTIRVPQDLNDFDMRVAVYGPGASAGGGIVSLKSGVDTGVIVEPSAASTTEPIILVGGPCVNSLTAQALQLTFPACGSASGLSAGEAIVKLVPNAFGEQAALLVYGWEAEDTLKAVQKIGEFTGADIKIGGEVAAVAPVVETPVEPSV